VTDSVGLTPVFILGADNFRKTFTVVRLV